MAEKKEPVAEKESTTKVEPVGYTTSEWNAYPFFQCSTCDFNTLVEADIVEHAASHKK